MTHMTRALRHNTLQQGIGSELTGGAGARLENGDERRATAWGAGWCVDSARSYAVPSTPGRHSVCRSRAADQGALLARRRSASLARAGIRRARRKVSLRL